MPDWTAIMADPLPVAGVMEFVNDPAAGGVCIFIGTTRAEMGPDGRELLALDYEAYEPMARMQLQDLARRARQRWSIAKLAILHRTGRVMLGQPSVIIGVSSPHREECFAACRFLIDTLKAEVTIWKKQAWATEGVRRQGTGGLHESGQ